MLGTCNTCIRLQSRVTSSGATVNSWMIYLFIFSFLSFVCLFCLFLFVAVDSVFIFCWPIFCCVVLSLSFLFLFILSAVFISLWVGLDLNFCWSENKISYFGAAYKYLSRGIELAVIKELFILCLYMCLCNIFTIHMCLLLMHGFNTWLCASLCEIVI